MENTSPSLLSTKEYKTFLTLPKVSDFDWDINILIIAIHNKHFIEKGFMGLKDCNIHSA